MTIKTVIDSSVFVSYFLEEENTHEEVKNLLGFLEEQSWSNIVPRIVAVETINTIYRKSKDEELSGRILIAANERNMTVRDIDKEVQAGARIVMKNINIKTSDLIIATVAAMSDSTLITWDTKLIKEASKICEALTPKQFLKKTKE
jgi:predicted nucleic acid-binding protein